MSSHLDGFRIEREISGRRGRLALLVRESPAALLVRAEGFVDPALLRADLAFAEEFGRAHPEGWDYVADTSAVRAAHPLNLLLLRRIGRLPYLRRYVVIAPSRAVRMLILASSLLVRPDVVLRSIEDLG